MKKEIIAGAILVLFLAASLLNARFISSQMGSISSQVAQAQALWEQGNSDAAADAIEAATQHWKKLDTYVHIMLRHDEIDPITDEFYSLQSEIEVGHVSSAGFKKLLTSLEELTDMERLSFSSVF